MFPIHTPSEKASFPEKHFNFLEFCKVFAIHLFPIHGGGVQETGPECDKIVEDRKTGGWEKLERECGRDGCVGSRG